MPGYRNRIIPFLILLSLNPFVEAITSSHNLASSNGNGTPDLLMAPEWKVGIGSESISPIMTSDINKDGEEEIIVLAHGVYESYDSVLLILSNDGKLLYSINSRIFDIGDVNGDRRSEIVTLDTVLTGNILPKVIVYKSDGSILWIKQLTDENYKLFERDSEYQFKILDINNDGISDIVLFHGNKKIYGIKGTNGEILFIIDPSNYCKSENIGLLKGIKFFDAKDIDGDEKIELLFGLTCAESTSPLKNAYHEVIAIKIDGTVLWRKRLGGETFFLWIPLISDFYVAPLEREDSGYDLFICTNSTCAIKGSDGSVLWQKDYIYNNLEPRILDLDKDGLKNDVIMDVSKVYGPIGDIKLRGISEEGKEIWKIDEYRRPDYAAATLNVGDLDECGSDEIAFSFDNIVYILRKNGDIIKYIQRNRPIQQIIIRKSEILFLSDLEVLLMDKNFSSVWEFKLKLRYNKISSISDINNDHIPDVLLFNKFIEAIDGKSGEVINKFGLGYLESLESCDLDEDGLNDILIAKKKSESAIILSNGTMIDQECITTKINDVNNDGELELIINKGNKIITYNNEFNIVEEYELPNNTWCRDFLVADITEDNLKEIILLLGECSLVLNSQWNVIAKFNTTGEYIRGQYSSDLTGDGFDEYITISYINNNMSEISAYSNKGNNLWSLKYEGGEIYNIYFIDVDGNKINDIIFSERWFGNFFVIKENGSVLWKYEPRKQKGYYFWDAYFYDIDGDSVKDILAKNMGTSLFAFRGYDGLELWIIPCGRWPPVIEDINNDLIEEILVLLPNTLEVRDIKSNKLFTMDLPGVTANSYTKTIDIDGDSNKEIIINSKDVFYILSNEGEVKNKFSYKFDSADTESTVKFVNVNNDEFQEIVISGKNNHYFISHSGELLYQYKGWNGIKDINNVINYIDVNEDKIEEPIILSFDDTGSKLESLINIGFTDWNIVQNKFVVNIGINKLNIKNILFNYSLKNDSVNTAIFGGVWEQIPLYMNNSNFSAEIQIPNDCNTISYNFIIQADSGLITSPQKNVYYLKINSDLGEVKGEGWYKDGSTTTIEAINKYSFPMSQIFDEWSGAVKSSSLKEDIEMVGPKVVSAKWKMAYSTEVYELLLFLFLVSGPLIIWLYRKQLF